MRKIEQQMIAAVKAKKNWESGNTEVKCEGMYVNVYLHGNHIACVGWQAEPNLYTFKRWPTRTTVSRLRALGVNASIKQFAPCINSEPI